MADGSRVTKVRHTVEALVGRQSRGTMLIGVHWPTKAALHGAGNLTTPAGKWSPNRQDQKIAMARQVRREYGLEQLNHVQLEVNPLKHVPFTFPEKKKAYYWSWVELVGRLDEMSPNERDVASHGWYCGPNDLETAIALMHESKALMFRWVLGLAIAVEPRLAPYRGLVAALPIEYHV